ncbi:MAG: phosphoglucosamine mutase, partial [Acidimicrobiales bacterium]
ILTGLLLADLVVRSGVSLAASTSGLLERVPQILRNVAVREPQRLASASAVWEAVKEVEDDLGTTGRVLLRPSGTEPVIRVMVESIEPTAAEVAVERICAVVEESLGRPTT